MRLRNLVTVVAFVLGGLSVAYCDDVIGLLRTWQYTNPFCVAAEAALADATCATRVQLEEELATQRRRLASAGQRQIETNKDLESAAAELGAAEAHVARLLSVLDVCEQVRKTQSGELAQCRQLIDAQEAVVRETNWRYTALANRLRELGQEGVVSVLVKE